jgi:hypothetical protein
MGHNQLMYYQGEKYTCSVRRFGQLDESNFLPATYEVQSHGGVEAKHRIRRKHETFFLVRLKGKYAKPYV